MWNRIVSPPDNLRFYKYSDSSAEHQVPQKEVNLDENKTTLFEPKLKKDKSMRVPESSLFNHIGEDVSVNTTSKDPSSGKSFNKAGSKNHESAFDLKTKGKNQGHRRQPSKSMLEGKKQKSSVNLSRKNQSSSIIREQVSKVTTSSKNDKSFLKRVDNQEDESFSRILAHQISVAGIVEKEKENTINMDSSCLYEMMTTLKEIRDISRDSLNTKKQLVQMLQNRNQISFLYENQDRSDTKQTKRKKERKSFRKTQEKSTVKKLGKSIVLEERLGKVEEKLRNLSRKVEEDISVKKGGGSMFLGRATTKKSTSALR